jgi:hypothetical protein
MISPHSPRHPVAKSGFGEETEHIISDDVTAQGTDVFEPLQPDVIPQTGSGGAHTWISVSEVSDKEHSSANSSDRGASTITVTEFNLKLYLSAQVTMVHHTIRRILSNPSRLQVSWSKVMYVTIAQCLHSFNQN